MKLRAKLETMILRLAQLIYDALGKEHPILFVIGLAIIGSIAFGGTGWLIVRAGQAAENRTPQAVASQVDPASTSPSPKPPHGFSIDTQNVFVVRAKRQGGVFPDGKFGIGIYDTVITNRSGKTATIKDAILRYTLRDKVIEVNSYVLNTATKENRIEIKSRSKGDRLIVSGWDNLRVGLRKDQALIDGAITRGSMYYVLEVTDPAELAHLKEITIVVRDFNDEESTHLITLTGDALKSALDLDLLIN